MLVVFLMTADYPTREGIGSYTLDLAKRIVDDGNEVLIYCPTTFKCKSYYPQNNLTVHCVHTYNIPLLKYFLFRKKVEKRLGLIKKPYILHYNIPLLLPIRNKKAIKSVVTVHSLVGKSYDKYENTGFLFFIKFLFVKTVSKKIEDYVLSSVDKTIVVSQDCFEVISKAAGCQVDLIENGIDLEHFAPDPKVEKDRSFLAVSRLAIGKGLESLIQAFVFLSEELRLEGWRLEIIGDGELYVELDKVIRKNKCSDVIVLLGKVPQTELPKHYNRSSFFISNSEYETGPRTLIEAASTGLPILSTVTGLVVKHRDLLAIELRKDNIVASINKAMHMSPDERRMLGIKAMNYTRARFNSKDKYLEILKTYEV